MSKALVFSALAWLAVSAGGWSATQCPPPGYSLTTLRQLQSVNFALKDSEARNSLALALLDCLSNADPEMRDRVAFEALSTWLRAQQLETATVVAIYARLVMQLESSQADPAGFTKPFAALVLSEVARADAAKPQLNAEQRKRLLAAATSYLTSITDYRGFNSVQGWRHGVAHGADLLMQLARNKALGKTELDSILNALASQVAPRGKHFYHYGEPERLAAAVLVIAQRAVHSKAQWQAWLQALSAPAPLPDWGAASSSQAGLAKRHNLMAFLLVMYRTLQESKDPKARELLLPALTAALRELP